MKPAWPVRRRGEVAVAPLVGAWIETLHCFCLGLKSLKSPPSWGRGLKHRAHAKYYWPALSPPSWGRGLKHRDRQDNTIQITSPPSWGRGLKPLKSIEKYIPTRSPPSGGRGLKLRIFFLAVGHVLSPPSWGRGLKQTIYKRRAQNIRVAFRYG